MRWRYLAQRATTGEFLDLDVPLTVTELSWALSGAGALKATITPETAQLRAGDGRSVLEEWGTLLFAEADGIIRWGGVLISSQFTGAQWAVEAAEYPAYLAGLPYTGDWARIGVDPLDAVREIWRHVQAQPDGDLNVIVDETTTGPGGPRLGEAAVPAYWEVTFDADTVPAADATWVREDSVKAGLVEYDAEGKLAKDITAAADSLTLQAIGKFATMNLPSLITIGSEKIRVRARSGLRLHDLDRGVGDSKATAHDKGTTVRFDGTRRRKVARVPAKPYRLAWYETSDCGAELDALARETPFDYRVTHAWNGPEITHRLQLGYPRLGTGRDDLAFVSGENITDVVTVDRSGDDFANAVIGLGAGEGAKAVRAEAAVRDGRLRRVAVYTDKSVARPYRLGLLAREELARRQPMLEIASIDVIDHPHAPIGSWQVGDDITVSARVPWLGDVTIVCRVVAWAVTGDATARLSLRRADSFSYAPPPEG